MNQSKQEKNEHVEQYKVQLQIKLNNVLNEKAISYENLIQELIKDRANYYNDRFNQGITAPYKDFVQHISEFASTSAVIHLETVLEEFSDIVAEELALINCRMHQKNTQLEHEIKQLRKLIK